MRNLAFTIYHPTEKWLYQLKNFYVHFFLSLVLEFSVKTLFSKVTEVRMQFPILHILILIFINYIVIVSYQRLHLLSHEGLINSVCFFFLLIFVAKKKKNSFSESNISWGLVRIVLLHLVDSQHFYDLV